MLEAANGLVAYDVREARETVLDALLMAVWFGKWSAAGVHDVARAAKTMPLPAGEQPTSTDLALDGLSEYYTSGPTIAAPRLRRALDAIANDQAVREVPRRMSFGLWAAYALGDHKAGFELGREYVALSREMGALNHLGEALHYVGLLELRAGSLTRANTCFAEEAELQQVRSIYNSGTVGEMLVCAWRGDANEVHARVERIRAVARERQLGWSAALAAVGLATLELALGNYRAATEGATDGWKDDIAVSALTASDAVEAHVRSGRPDAAAEYLAWLEELARATNMPYELGLLARSRALASEDADTELLYEEAIKRLAESGGALHLGRAQLLYGEWLRRRKRRRDAREQLRLAHETFDEQGAAAFAERARVELLATGETARKRVDETRDDLTPQEAQIASLAAEGGTNLEIATQLFISASTVEYHLRKVYRKLGISSRRALAGAISAN
jgi:DNA-binding CsgD family transcriptional regulator